MSVVTLPRTMSLEALASELVRRQDAKFDFVADTRRVGFWTDEPVKGMGRASFLKADGIDDGKMTPDGFPISQYAHGQIAQRLGIPKKYYDRMRADAPRLLDQNVMHWFTEQPETRLVRTLDGKVRAFLSDRYRRLDDFDLMELSVLPVLRETPGLTVHLAALTDTRMHIRAYLPGMTAPDPGSIRPYGGQEVGTYYGGQAEVGDFLCAGVSIRNSEVGAGALVAEPWIMRLACKNGLTIPAFAMRKYHIGKQIREEEDALDVFSAEALAADDTAFFLKVRDVIRAALSEVKFQEIVSRLQEAAQTEPMRKPLKGVEVLTQRFSLTEDEQESVVGHLIQGGDLTQWGAVNAITAAAQDAEGYERQAELEAIGGVLAVLPAHEWRAVAKA